MPLDNSFSKFLEEKSLVRSASLEKLRGTRIAVDAHNWMKVLTPKINEPYQAVMGVPLTVGKAISTEFDRFKKANTTPIFVFNGLYALSLSFGIQLPTTLEISGCAISQSAQYDRELGDFSQP
ncbi:viral life cyclerelated protein [Diplonema papillatum]|nr:viral life cyclerelated protein [Diplonema papillatum]